ncbi:MAG: TlpA family protein disulfide reductase [Acidobacteriia bacterium]|nr:TlpA family protein disulfide reductase [Terriglobia bacterium]
MKRRFALFTALILAAVTIRAEQISVLTSRIADLAAKEPPNTAVETLLRAADLLKPVNPRASQKFQSQGIDLLRKHPEVLRDRTIVNSLFSLDPKNAESLIMAGTNRVNAYNELLRYSNQRGQWDRAANVFHEALGDRTIANHVEDLWATGIIDNLVGVDSKRASALLAEVSAITTTDNARARLSNSLNNLLLSFGGTTPDRLPEIRDALLLLLPQVRELTVSRAPFPGRKFTVGNQVVEVKNGQERLLFRFGAFLHALAPDAYISSKDLFGPWDSILASVNTVQEAAAVPFSPGGNSLAVNPAAAAPPALPAAVAAAEKAPPGASKVAAYGMLIARRDLPLEKRAALIPHAVEALRLIPLPSDELPPAENLLDIVDAVAWTDGSVIKPVVAEYLDVTQKTGRHPGQYHWIARDERGGKFALDSDDPSLLAMRTIIDLEEAVLPNYDFTLTDLDGKARRLSEQRGKIVLLNFWATWCGPCRAEMPLLDKTNQDWAAKGLAMFNITDETAETVTSFLRQFKYSLPVMLDNSRKVFDRYDVLGIPRTYILDRSGQIFATLPEAFTEAELDRVLKSAGLE